MVEIFRKYVQTTIVKSTGIYIVANFVKSLIPFFMLPIMTSYLSKEDYGTITMLTTIFAFATPFITLELNSAIQRRYYYKDEDISKYIGNCFIISFIALLVIFGVMILIVSPLSKEVHISKLFLLLTPLYCYACLFERSVMSYWQVNEQPIKFGIMSILHTICELGLAIYLIVCLHFNWQGRAISIMTVACLFAIVSFFILRKNSLVKFMIDKNQINHALKYGLGLVPHSIGGSLITLSNRFFLTSMISVSETGLYGVASQFSGIIYFFTISLNNAFVPWLFKKLSTNDINDKNKVVKFTYIYMLGLPLLGLLIYIFIRIVFPFLVDESFDESMKYVPWLLLGAVFNGYYYVFTNYILYAEKTHILAIITFIAGLLSLPLNYLLINNFGAIGSAIANACVFFIYFLMVAVCAMKIVKMPWLQINK